MNSAATTEDQTKLLRRTGKVAVGFLLLTMVVFSVIRSLDMMGSSEGAIDFEARYFEHPVVASIHMFFSMAFILLAPLQFSQKIRSKHRKFHRYLGRVLLTCATISGVYGIASIFVLPVFGGLPSITSAWFFGPFFLWCIAKGYWHARNRRFVEHREWMIRLFALGLGVGTQRIIVGILQINGYGFYESFGPALWLGFSINLLIAEFWIHITSNKKLRRSSREET